jgi:hypothetical protein
VPRALAIAAIAVALGGCPSTEYPDDVILFARSSPPPAHEGRIVNSDDDGYKIEMSRGVAIAAQCWDTCEVQCARPQAVAETQGIVEVRPIYRLGNPDAVEYALVAVAAGGTTLDVSTTCARRTYTVQVTEE